MKKRLQRVLASRGYQRWEGQREQGSVVILVALALTGLIGIGAMVTDVGMLYAKHAHLQNALDAAALSGAQELPGDKVKAEQMARANAAANNVNSVNVGFRAGNSEIVVKAQQQVPAYLATIWKISGSTIGATARAINAPPKAIKGAVPLCVQDQKLIYGESYTLKSGPNGDGAIVNSTGSQTGWYGALRLDSSTLGASDYENNLAHGFVSALKVGQVLGVEHGNMSQPTYQAITYRFDQDTRVPQNTFQDHDRDAPELVYLPIVKIVEQDGVSVNNVKIVGFAAFFIESVEGNGINSIVKGRFLSKAMVVDGQALSSLADLFETEKNLEQGIPITDYGLYAPKLLPN